MELIKFTPRCASNLEPLSKYIETYLSQKKRADTYRKLITWLRDYTGKDISEISEDDAIRWVQSLESANQAGNTIRQRVHILKGIYNYLLKRGLVTLNPFAIINIPNKDCNRKRYRNLISYNLVSKIIASDSTGDYKSLAYQAMFALLFCGLRISEVINLKVADVRFLISEVQVILRQTKNGDDAIITLPEFASQYLLKYCQNSPRSGDRNVFDTSIRTLARRFKKACGDYGVEASPHDARATCATKLIDDGTPIQEVQKYLRHKNINSTQVYVLSQYQTHKRLKF